MKFLFKNLRVLHWILFTVGLFSTLAHLLYGSRIGLCASCFFTGVYFEKLINNDMSPKYSALVDKCTIQIDNNLELMTLQNNTIKILSTQLKETTAKGLDLKKRQN